MSQSLFPHHPSLPRQLCRFHRSQSRRTLRRDVRQGGDATVAPERLLGHAPGRYECRGRGAGWGWELLHHGAIGFRGKLGTTATVEDVPTLEVLPLTICGLDSSMAIPQFHFSQITPNNHSLLSVIDHSLLTIRLVDGFCLHPRNTNHLYHSLLFTMIHLYEQQWSMVGWHG